MSVEIAMVTAHIRAGDTGQRVRVTRQRSRADFYCLIDEQCRISYEQKTRLFTRGRPYVRCGAQDDTPKKRKKILRVLRVLRGEILWSKLD